LQSSSLEVWPGPVTCMYVCMYDVCMYVCMYVVYAIFITCSMRALSPKKTCTPRRTARAWLEKNAQGNRPERRCDLTCPGLLVDRLLQTSTNHGSVSASSMCMLSTESGQPCACRCSAGARSTCPHQGLPSLTLWLHCTRQVDHRSQIGPSHA
jgi:hypothetical protein